MSDAPADEPVLVPLQGEPGHFIFWCPGCCCAHQVDPRWTVTGTAARPTVQASVLVRSPGKGADKNREVRCHLFVEDGRIRFLDDCSHPLAGKTVDMEPLP